MSLVDMVLVERLAECLDPFWALEVEALTDWTTVMPVTEFVKDDLIHRNDAYNYGRIRYFHDEALKQQKVEPIEVNVYWNRHSPSGLSLDDGHHRLAGFIIAEAGWIPAAFSGPLEALAWLKGETDVKPEWL